MTTPPTVRLLGGPLVGDLGRDATEQVSRKRPEFRIHIHAKGSSCSGESVLIWSNYFTGDIRSRLSGSLADISICGVSSRHVTQ